ncbi:MAG: winged helix-turn-helix transcriptional regulator [Chloroflexota bacterium]
MDNTHKKLDQMDTTIRVYCFIVGYLREHRIAPTQREIARGSYISKGAVLRHLDRLQMWGYIGRVENATRNIVLTNPAPFHCDDG